MSIEYDPSYRYHEVYGLYRCKDGITERYDGNGKWRKVDVDIEEYIADHFMDDNIEKNLTKEQVEFWL